jgi:hypothetical protein
MVGVRVMAGRGSLGGSNELVSGRGKVWVLRGIATDCKEVQE